MPQYTSQGLPGLNAADFPGGGLDYYSASGANGRPYANEGYTTVQSPWSKMTKYNPLVDIGDKIDPTGSLGGIFEDMPGGDLLGGLFGGGDKKPKTPYWKRLANKEWAQGNAVLSAYDALYEPTLAIARRSAGDYGDLHRRAANEDLAHSVLTNRVTREADLRDYEELGPELLGARRAADPLFGQAWDLASQELTDASQPLPANVARDITERVRGSQASRGMGLGGSDAFEEAMQLVLGGEEYRGRRSDRAFGHAGGLLTAFGDPFQSLTGRTSRPAPVGGNFDSPDYTGFNENLFSYGVNDEIQKKNMQAASKAGDKAMAGQIIGGLLGAAGGMAGLCWVAREVFGERDTRWIAFRSWLVNFASDRFYQWYCLHGETFAAKLKTRPAAKAKLKVWMQSKIDSLTPGRAELLLSPN